jgi:hypothetical protein
VGGVDAAAITLEAARGPMVVGTQAGHCHSFVVDL